MATQNDRRNRVFNCIFALFAIRIFYLIFCSPFLGIANNGDFERLMQTVGLAYTYNPWISENYDKTFWSYFTNGFAYITPVENGWVQIFSVFPKIAIFISRLKNVPLFDIRFLGLVNAAVYLLSVYVIVQCIKRVKGIWAYVLLLTSLLFLGDPFILQYLNSFYTEIGSVSGMLLVLGLLVLGFLTVDKQNLAIKIFLIAGISVSSLFAVLSKQQDILVLFPIIVAVCLLLKRMNAHVLIQIGWSVAVLAVALSLFMNNTAGGNVTAYNVTMMDLLHHSEMPETHLQEMGYDEEEIAYISEGIGGNAFTHGEIYGDHSEDFTRTNELKIILREPTILLPMLKARCRVLFRDDPNLGNYQAGFGFGPKTKATDSSLLYNLKQFLYISNFWFYLMVLLVALSLAIIGVAKFKNMGIPVDLFWVYGMLPVSNLIRFVTVIMGDSSHDDYKHFFMLNVEFDIIVVIGLCLFIWFAIETAKRLRSCKQPKEIEKLEGENA